MLYPEILGFYTEEPMDTLALRIGYIKLILFSKIGPRELTFDNNVTLSKTLNFCAADHTHPFGCIRQYLIFRFA